MVKTIDTDHIYKVAEQFEHTANMLSTQMGTSGAHPPVSPFVVNVTFSIELYLKCLLILETNRRPKNSHELHTIFNRLSSESRSIITSDFQNSISSDATIRVMKTQFPDLKVDIQSVLLGMNNAFKEWRYASIDGMSTSSVMGTSHLLASIKKRILYLKSL